MKKLFLLTCLFLPSYLYAQYDMNVYSSHAVSTGNNLLESNSLLLPSTLDAPGLGKKKKGTKLIVLGSIFFGSGAVVLATSDGSVSIYLNGTNGNGTYGANNLKAEAGLLSMAVGVGLFIPGVIIYSKGNRMYKAYQEGNEVSLRFHGAGLALRCKL